MTLKLNRTGPFFDREYYQKENENWNTIENNFNNVVNTISDEAYQKVVDSAKLLWQQPVDTFDDLSTVYPSPEEGWAVMVRDTGKIYRYNGTEWTEVQDIDPSAINEVDNRLKSKIEEETKLTSPVVSGFWNPPTQPTARSDEPGYFASAFSITANQLINDLYEPMRNDYPGYITRLNKGKDQSGMYDWWRYEFTPSNYEKTIILGAGMHGGETGGALGLYLFLKELAYNWNQHPQLAYIRNKVRLIVLPCQNPWGMSQDPKVRQNSNGVDINRNFDYKWEYFPTQAPFDHEYKGTAPRSEAETDYICDTLEAFQNAIAYIDFHNFMSPTANYAIYTPRFVDAPKDTITKVIDHLKAPGDIVRWGEMDNPCGFIYAADQFGMHGLNPEFGDGIWSSSYDSVEMTKYVEWYGNLILQISTLKSKMSVVKTGDSLTKRVVYEHTGTPYIVLPKDENGVNGIYQEIPEFRLSFDIPTSGILVLSGEITIAGSGTEEPQSFFTPMLGQELNLTSHDFNPFDVKKNYWEVYCEGYQRQTLSFSAEIPVYPTSRDIGQAIMGLYAKSTVANITVYRYRSTAMLIPSEIGQRVQIFDATGNAGSGVGAAVKHFPDDNSRGHNI